MRKLGDKRNAVRERHQEKLVQYLSDGKAECSNAINGESTLKLRTGTTNNFILLFNATQSEARLCLPLSLCWRDSVVCKRTPCQTRSDVWFGLCREAELWQLPVGSWCCLWWIGICMCGCAYGLRSQSCLANSCMHLCRFMVSAVVFVTSS